MASISRFLERKLKVKVNKDKSKVVRAQDSSFSWFHVHKDETDFH